MELLGVKIGAGELLILGMGSQWLLSALAHSLPPPDEKTGKFYLTFNNLVHFCASNFDRMKDGKPPQVP